jgi:hypothetical protein
VMISLRRRITKRSKRQCSAGCFMTTLILNRALKTSLSWASIIMYQTLLLWLIDWGHAFRSLMSYQRISQLFSMKDSISSTQIWFQKL